MKIGIVGGGASGMMAAIAAAKAGADVIILEQRERVGKKLLMTGNGKCNLSNLSLDERNYYSEGIVFAQEILARFSVKDTLDFFRQAGLLYKDKEGYVYPFSGQAATVLDVLRGQLERLDVRVLTRCQVTGVEAGRDFRVRTSKGVFLFDRLILACGSPAGLAAAPGQYSYGLDLAGSLGHTIIKTLPGLPALHCEGMNFKALAGIRSDVVLTLRVGKKQYLQKGELQLTDYGLSGIPVFQLSRFAAKALAAGETVTVSVDFLPLLPLDRLTAYRDRRFAEMVKGITFEDFFTGIMHKRISTLAIKKQGYSPQTIVDQVSLKGIAGIFMLLKNWEVKVIGTNPMAKSQIMVGGGDCRELTYSMESTRVKGLYFTGEMVDVDGQCGGYNLQWAWSSGWVAGKNAAPEEE